MVNCEAKRLAPAQRSMDPGPAQLPDGHHHSPVHECSSSSAEDMSSEGVGSESVTLDSGNDPPSESNTSSRPLFRELMAADVDDLETSEIESLCMVCREMVSVLDPS